MRRASRSVHIAGQNVDVDCAGAEPAAAGPKGGYIARQNSSTVANYSISTAPTVKAAGTYTVQFLSAGRAIV